jgi:hypothetical protein
MCFLAPLHQWFLKLTLLKTELWVYHRVLKSVHCQLLAAASLLLQSGSSAASLPPEHKLLPLYLPNEGASSHLPSRSSNYRLFRPTPHYLLAALVAAAFAAVVLRAENYPPLCASIAAYAVPLVPYSYAEVKARFFFLFSTSGSN